jgi:hypothetical protein
MTDAGGATKPEQIEKAALFTQPFDTERSARLFVTLRDGFICSFPFARRSLCGGEIYLSSIRVTTIN